jgi:acyl-CoA synthetase (NDP forming)
MAQVNIKPNRIKFIKSLEDSLKAITSEAKEYEAAKKRYEKELALWETTSAVDFSPANIKSLKINLDYRSDKPFEVKVVLKKYPTDVPKKPTAPALNGWQLEEAVKEMTSIINMLKLTDEEVVSASVANKVAVYLR